MEIGKFKISSKTKLCGLVFLNNNSASRLCFTALESKCFSNSVNGHLWDQQCSSFCMEHLYRGHPSDSTPLCQNEHTQSVPGYVMSTFHALRPGQWHLDSRGSLVRQGPWMDKILRDWEQAASLSTCHPGGLLAKIRITYESNSIIWVN